MFDPTTDQILAVMAAKGYRVFDDESKDYNLNLIGIRTRTAVPNRFDDWMYVLWKFGGLWTMKRYSITTDPGTFWLLKPEARMGTAIMKEGQYAGLWMVGLHKGYKALQQKANVTVHRDNNRDAQHNFNGPTDNGLFGINCHRANQKLRSIQVDKWSAGCQVFADPFDFEAFLKLCDKAKANWGNSFTYTLLGEGDF